MFGKPEWFVPKRFGWGLTPVTWQGWVYAGVWSAVLSLPFVALLLAKGWVEAVVWMAAMMVLLVIDVKFILAAMKRQEEEKEVFRIMDEEETRTEEAQTGKFAMHVGDSKTPQA